MAHLIEKTDGLALAGKKAWHGLGTVVDEDMSPYQAMHIANLDWEVEKAPLTCTTTDGKEIKMSGKYALVRKDTKEVVGNCVSSKYQVKQNKSMFDDIYEVANAEDVTIETAGSLRGGQTVFALAHISTMGLQNGDDQIKQYAMFRMGHTGFDAYTLRGTDIRVLCGNTEGMAMRDKSITIRHMGQRISDDRIIDELRAHLGDIKAQARVFERQMVTAIETEWDEDMLAQYFSKVWSKMNGGIDKNVESVNHRRMIETVGYWKELATEHVYQENCRNTAYAAYQAVTQYATHDVATRDTGNGAEDARTVSVLEGRGREVRDIAHNVLVDAAGLPVSA